MIDWQKSHTDLNLENRVSRINDDIRLLKDTAPKVDPEKIRRLGHVSNLVGTALNHANINNTSLVVYQRIAAAYAAIDNALFKTSGDYDYDELNTSTDILLEQLPLIGAANETTQLIEDKAADFETYVAESRGKVNEAASETRKKLDELVESAEEVLKLSNSSLDEIRDLKVDANSLSSYLSGHVLKGDYAMRATKESEIAKKWTIVTWISAGTSVLLLALIFILHLRGMMDAAKQDYQLISAQILMTATLGLIAKWSSRRANRHLVEEARYHRLAVNMQAINGFISKLSPGAHDKVISALAISNFSDPTLLGDLPLEYESPLTEIAKSAFGKGKP